ncbi:MULTISPECIES: amidohydrolase family protein [unclassified Aerococcus]|uniref:Amidohydrolase family protein n=1 Tax=Aerococcus sanguinicola TaxID=119206 RepID=A0A5N1GPN3_9LACT|nr:amidohydrolase family protein [Aerococcus sanguinicola]
MFYDAPFKLCLDHFGAERILWSVDYPYVRRDNAWDYLANFGLEEAVLQAIAYANAERLYGI